MTRQSRAALAAAAAAVIAWWPEVRGADVPEWFRQAANRSLTEAQLRSAAVVLSDEEVNSVSASGELKTRRRYAAKVLTVEGRDAAALRALYLTDTGRIRDIRAWVVRPSGETLELGREHVADSALVGDDVYNEVRQRVVSLGASSEPGVVFGAEVTTEGRCLFNQLAWELQDRWPVARVTRSIELPSGWGTSSVTFNHRPVEPVNTGATWTWTLENLPRIADEPSSAPWSSLTPRVAVTFDTHGRQGGPPAFADWSSVSRWMAAQSDPASAPAAIVQAKAREVTGQATEFERVAALTALVQDVQYVSIQIGLGRGGGYRPKPAADVLLRGHGDCKDKAALLRALLGAIGQRAYLVAVFAGDPGYVREAWPSPHQFNHMIVAMQVAETGRFPAGGDVPGIGKVLFFDPTDPFTPIGQLPLADQGGLGLVLAPAGGALVRLPEVDAEANGFSRTVDAVVDASGALVGTLHDRFTGGLAAAARAARRNQWAEGYARSAGGGLTVEIPRAELTGFEPADSEGEFSVKALLRAPSYARTVQGRLAVVRCPTRLSTLLPAVGQSERRTPVALKARSAVERFILALGGGLRVDELPVAASGHAPYGSYAVRVSRVGNRVAVEREITTRRTVVEPEDYASLRSFVESARSVDAATIVLARER